jgi:hypothetical protein
MKTIEVVLQLEIFSLSFLVMGALRFGLIDHCVSAIELHDNLNWKHSARKGEHCLD